MIRERKPPVRPKRKPRVTERIGRTLDTVVCDLMPSWGAKRRLARYGQDLADRQIEAIERLGYSWAGAAPSEVRDHRYFNTRTSPDDAIENDLPDLRNRCVELYRNNTVAHSAVESRVSYEIGTGLTRSPRVRETDGISKEQADAINDDIKEVYDRWSDHGIDKRRRFSLYATQRQACRTYAVYGEVFILFSQAAFRGSIGLTVDIISPERVETPPNKAGDPNCRMGIQYDAAGNIAGYWVRYEHPDSKYRGFHHYEYKFVPRFDEDGQPRILHVFDPLFPEQSRGIPWLATAMNRMKDLDDFFEAELIGKQIEACFGLIIKSGDNGLTPQEIAERRANGDPQYRNLRSEDLQAGNVNYINGDDDVVTIDPNRPGSTFAPFIEQGLRSIAAALNFPYEALAKNFFRTTFSSGKLAMLDGWMGFSMRQQVLIEQFLRPLHRRVLRDGIFMGEIPSIDAMDYLVRPHVYERHRWIGQPRGFIDEEKETKAALAGNQGGIETKANIWGLKGEDWEDAEEQLDIEERRKIELRTEREVWEDELRKAKGLEPIQRQYNDSAGGADRMTMPESQTENEEEAEPVAAE